MKIKRPDAIFLALVSHVFEPQRHRHSTTSLPDSPILLLTCVFPPPHLRLAPFRPRPSPRILAYISLLSNPRPLQRILAPPIPHPRLRRGRLTQSRLTPPGLHGRSFPAGHPDRTWYRMGL